MQIIVNVKALHLATYLPIHIYVYKQVAKRNITMQRYAIVRRLNVLIYI